MTYKEEMALISAEFDRLFDKEECASFKTNEMRGKFAFYFQAGLRFRKALDEAHMPSALEKVCPLADNIRMVQ